MNHKTRRHLLLFIFVMLCGLTATATLATPASSRSAAPQQATAFLSAPYYGSTWLSSIFDHDPRARHILAFTGAVAQENNCPCQPLPPEPPPNPNCSHPNFPSAYLSCNIRRYLYYDGHNGIDYVLRYAYVRAAAPGTVARANWANQANHQASYGLHVRIDHDINGDRITDYQTIYGHMSVLRVRQNDEIPVNADEFARIIGISGNTGDSTGPHLHFEVRNAAGTPVDPYGPDRNPDHKLWIERPSIDPHVIYTSGNRLLTAPPIVENESGYFTVDDGDASFAENPAGCWTVDTTTGWNTNYRHRNVPDGNCTATWNFPGTPGRYNVFVYVPNFWNPAWPDNQAIPANRNATVDAAQYTVYHTVSSSQPNVKQDNVAVVNQWAYPNGYHRSPWVYIGTYYFNNQFGTDYVRLESQAMNPVGQMRMTADAVRFVPVRYRTYLPLVLKCYPAIVPATPVLNTISNPTRAPNYTVSWQPASGAETYTLQEATNPNFSGAVTVYSGAGTLWAATNKPVGTYYYRVRATNCAGNSGWSAARSTIVSPPGWVTIASQNFEGTFPGDWIVWDDNGSTYGEYYWGKRNCRPYAGSYSGWGVGGGAQGAALSCGSTYPHNARSWMVYGPFDLRDAAAGEMRFQVWLSTEPGDEAFWGVSVNGVNFYGYAWSTQTGGWVEKGIDFTRVPTLTNVLGREAVWVALVFSSDGSGARAEGVYVDNIEVRVCYRGCPGSRYIQTWGGQREGGMAVVQRPEGIPRAPAGVPQPFLSPLSAPEPFRSPLPVPQP